MADPWHFLTHLLLNVTLMTTGEVAGPMILSSLKRTPLLREVESLVLGHPAKSGVKV